MKNELRSFWARYLNFNWKFGLFLILLICIPRFVLVLFANKTGNYSYIGLIMAISAIVPFLFLNRNGQKIIGISKPEKIRWLPVAFLAGLTASFILYFMGKQLFGNTIENWYVYIGRSYNIPPGIDNHHKNILFAVMAFTGMTFSPVGEELFFRGIVHGAFANSAGERKASIIDSLAFALTHISHFGIIYTGSRWIFATIPAAIWVTGMFLVSILFFYFKRKTGSLLGAILCHAAFNFGMIFCIFYLL